MSNVILKELDVTNFRSIRGHVHAPLDAKVVLIHGENGSIQLAVGDRVLIDRKRTCVAPSRS